MQAMDTDIFTWFFYAGGATIFIVALIPLLIAGFFLFSMLPGMLFSRFYDRMYKRLGFLPETVLFLLCCGMALILSINIMQSPPLCLDPVPSRNAQRFYVYTVVHPQGAPPHLPVGTVVYSTAAPQHLASDRLITILRAQLPAQRQAVTLNVNLAREHLAAVGFLRHPFAFAARQCKPAFMVDPQSLGEWPQSLALRNSRSFERIAHWR
jgi:hypothetical protein